MNPSFKGYATGAEISGCACRGEDHHGPGFVVCLPCGQRRDGWAGGVRGAELLCDEQFKNRAAEQRAVSSQPCDLYSEGRRLPGFSACRSSLGVMSE